MKYSIYFILAIGLLSTIAIVSAEEKKVELTQEQKDNIGKMVNNALKLINASALNKALDKLIERQVKVGQKLWQIISGRSKRRAVRAATAKDGQTKKLTEEEKKELTKKVFKVVEQVAANVYNQIKKQNEAVKVATKAMDDFIRKYFSKS